MNAQLVASEALPSEFELDVVPLQFAATIADLGTVNLGKLVARRRDRGAAGSVVREPARRALPHARAAAAGVSRDAGISHSPALRGVPRIVHLHARPERAVLPLLRRALAGATVILLAPGCARISATR